jgi:hypothetical protein
MILELDRIRKNVENKKSSLQFLPELLVEISKEKYFIHKTKKLKVSYLIDITHNLILKYYFKKDNIFNLSSLILRDKYGYNYNLYISYLVEIKVIKLIQNHLKGSNSRIYKLNDAVIKNKIIRYNNTDSVLLKKYKNAVASVDENDIKTNGIEQFIKQKLVDDLFHINIDSNRSLCFLDSTKQDIDIYNRNKYSVECIRDKHIFYHFDNYGRLHTNFTILKSFIRKNCLIIDGEETCEIDIVNSQPLFLCKLINKSNYFVDSNELILFKKLTIGGKFYQYIEDNSIIKQKGKVKEMVYKVLFGKNYNSKEDRIFRGLFPTIYNFIKVYKKESGDYRTLAYDLQRSESNLIFNKIIKEIIIVHPDIKIVTVHDSIVYAKKYKSIVENIFNRKLEEEFDI